MNPHQQNKLDIGVSTERLLRKETSLDNLEVALIGSYQKLSPDEQRLFRLYGKLPTKKDVLQNKLKVRVNFLSWQSQEANL